VVNRVLEVLGVRRGPAAGLLVMLLALDVGLIAAYLAHRLAGWPEVRGFRLGNEWGYGEVMLAVQLAWVAGLAAWVALRARWPVMAVWACGYAVILVDDRFMLHERAGDILARRVDLVPDGADGELVWLGAVALVVGSALLVLHLRAGQAARAASGGMLLVTVALAAFGVGADWLHSLTGLRGPVTANFVMTAIEEGGELVVSSLVVAHVFAVACDGHRPPLRGRVARVLGVRVDDVVDDAVHAEVPVSSAGPG
jgi:hypothetical protein